jgi:hypothetical protein
MWPLQTALALGRKPVGRVQPYRCSNLGRTPGVQLTASSVRSAPASGSS